MPFQPSLSHRSAILFPSAGYPYPLSPHYFRRNFYSSYLLWAPSHRGIPGNENVDSAAKQALLLLFIRSSLLPSNSDLLLFINKFIRLSWFDLWRSQHSNILAQIKDSPLSWSSFNLPSRSHEITITRLRIGHTCLTHTYLFTHLMPLSCPHCDPNPLLSVEHILVCPELDSLRNSHHIPHSHIDALYDSSSSP